MPRSAAHQRSRYLHNQHNRDEQQRYGHTSLHIDSRLASATYLAHLHRARRTPSDEDDDGCCPHPSLRTRNQPLGSRALTRPPYTYTCRQPSYRERSPTDTTISYTWGRPSALSQRTKSATPSSHSSTLPLHQRGTATFNACLPNARRYAEHNLCRVASDAVVMNLAAGSDETGEHEIDRGRVGDAVAIPRRSGTWSAVPRAPPRPRWPL